MQAYGCRQAPDKARSTIGIQRDGVRSAIRLVYDNVHLSEDSTEAVLHLSMVGATEFRQENSHSQAHLKMFQCTQPFGLDKLSYLAV